MFIWPTSSLYGCISFTRWKLIKFAIGLQLQNVDESGGSSSSWWRIGSGPDSFRFSPSHRELCRPEKCRRSHYRVPRKSSTREPWNADKLGRWRRDDGRDHVVRDRGSSDFRFTTSHPPNDGRCDADVTRTTRHMHARMLDIGRSEIEFGPLTAGVRTRERRPIEANASWARHRKLLSSTTLPRCIVVSAGADVGRLSRHSASFGESYRVQCLGEIRRSSIIFFRIIAEQRWLVVVVICRTNRGLAFELTICRTMETSQIKSIKAA